MTLRSSLVVSVALLLAACGPSGSLSGTVTVEGGSAANLVVFVYGPESKATVTADDGSFTAGSLPDGTYLVRVVVKGAEVEEQTAPGTVKNGKSQGDLALAFKMPVGKVTGHVAFSDGSDASGLPVTLVGAATRGGKTAAGGAFSFEGLPAGGYVVAAEAADTQQGRLAVSAAVSGAAVDVGELRFTTVGTVAGTVTAASMPVAGASVAVAGTTLVAVTDAMGRFELTGVPTGDRTFTARTEVPPRVASATATIARGANMDVALSLVEETRRGTVSGAITFVGQQSPKIITVSAPGTSATAQPGPDGAYSLSLPIGDWDVVATAPLYPKKTLGHVHVVEGQTVTLPGDTLSWYEPFWSGPATLTGVLNVVAPAGGSPWYLAIVLDALGTRSLVINRVTRDVRLVASGAAGNPVFSRQGHYLAFTLNFQLFTYDLTTGDLKPWAYTTSANDPAAIAFGFSSDESVLFVARRTNSPPVGYYLERITVASGQVVRYPATGSLIYAPQPTASPDRWVVRENNNDVALLTPTADFQQVFTGVSQLAPAPMILALTNCAVTCTMKVVGPNATSALTVVGAFPPGVGFFTFGGAPIGTADYVPLTWGSSYGILRSSDAMMFPLPNTLSWVAFNSLGTRYAYGTTGGGFSIFEDALPPSAMLTPVWQGTVSPMYNGYVTANRFVVYEPGASARVVDVKAGVATSDTDVIAAGPAPQLQAGCFAWQGGGATGKWKVFAGDRAAVVTDVPATMVLGFGNLAARGGDPSTDYCALSFDNATSVVVDGSQGTFRRSTTGKVVSGSRGERWGAMDVFQVQRPTGTAFVSFATDQLIETVEPGFNSNLAFTAPTDHVQFAVRDRTLYLGFAR